MFDNLTGKFYEVYGCPMDPILSWSLLCLYWLCWNWGLKEADGFSEIGRTRILWNMRNFNQKYKRQKNKSRYIIVLINTFQQKCQYAKSFQRKKMSNSNSSSEDEGNPNSSEGLHDTEVGIGDDVLTTSHLLLSILFRRRWLTWTPALKMTTMATAQPPATAQALRRFSSFSKRPA